MSMSIGGISPKPLIQQSTVSKSTIQFAGSPSQPAEKAPQAGNKSVLLTAGAITAALLKAPLIIAGCLGVGCVGVIAGGLALVFGGKWAAKKLVGGLKNLAISLVGKIPFVGPFIEKILRPAAEATAQAAAK